MAICDQIGCPISEEKTVWAEPLMTFLGMLLNGRHLTISIPAEKITKTISWLKTILNKRKITIKTVQTITGLLNFLNHAVVPGRTFTRRMYDKLKIRNSKGEILKPHHHITVDADF